MSQGQVLSPSAAALAPEGNNAIERRDNANELATAQLQAQAIAGEQAAYAIALKNRRDWDVVRQKLLRECERTTFADSALYKKPVGGKTITGLSVRFVEAAFRCMGNVRTKRYVTFDDATRRKILIVCSDLESNNHFESEITLEKTVERRNVKEGQHVHSTRLNSQGQKTYLVDATEDDLLTKESAAASKFIRQNGLRIVPGDLQDECTDAINQTISKKVEQDPDAERKKLLDAFDDLGVRADNVKQFLGVTDLSTLTPKDLITLRGVYTAIRDGETNWREVMEQRETARGTAEPSTTRTAEVLSKLNANKPAEQAAVKVDIPGVVTGADLFGKQDNKSTATKYNQPDKETK